MWVARNLCGLLDIMVEPSLQMVLPHKSQDGATILVDLEGVKPNVTKNGSEAGAGVAWQRSWDDFVLRGFKGWSNALIWLG